MKDHLKYMYVKGDAVSDNEILDRLNLIATEIINLRNAVRTLATSGAGTLTPDALEELMGECAL